MPYKDPEVRKAFKKEYYQKNKQRLSELMKINRQNNKEDYKERQKIYNKTPNGLKSYQISKWKSAGVICSDYDLLYSNYLAETYCDFCRVKFGKKGDGTGTFKCLDHSHKTGLFRNFLCCACNIRRGE